MEGGAKSLFGGVRVAVDGTRFVFLHNTDPKNAIRGKVRLLPGKMNRPATPMYNINQHGENKGQGISYYQYNFPINIYKINRGDSIHIAIRHDMKREILPGVSDIGVKITKNDQ